MVKRVLLIGASKHIGFHILEEIASQKDTYSLFVLARTPKDRIAEFKGRENVTFIQGDAKDQGNINNVINITMQGKVDYIVITVGGAVVFNKFGMPRVDDPKLCGAVANTVVNAVQSLPSQPIIIATSSTGILSTANKLPLLLKPLYKLILAEPHVDKINMENAIADNMQKWVLVRGALYTDGKKKGVYRTGEMEIGYTISRRDIADFIVRECLNGEKWIGKRPVVVY